MNARGSVVSDRTASFTVCVARLRVLAATRLRHRAEPGVIGDRGRVDGHHPAVGETRLAAAEGADAVRDQQHLVRRLARQIDRADRRRAIQRRVEQGLPQFGPRAAANRLHVVPEDREAEFNGSQPSDVGVEQLEFLHAVAQTSAGRGVPHHEQSPWRRLGAAAQTRRHGHVEVARAVIGGDVDTRSVAARWHDDGQRPVEHDVPLVSSATKRAARP